MKKRFHDKCGHRSGFSLIEIVITLAVISVGLIAVIGLIPQGVQSARDATDSTLAATIAQDTINTLRQQSMEPAFSWASLSTPQDIYYDATGTNPVNTTVPTADTYYRVHLVPQWNANFMTIAATVWWPVKTGTTKPLNTNTFFTVIANYQH